MEDSSRTIIRTGLEYSWNNQGRGRIWRKFIRNLPRYRTTHGALIKSGITQVMEHHNTAEGPIASTLITVVC